jgi:hypothetical protein
MDGWWRAVRGPVVALVVVGVLVMVAFLLDAGSTGMRDAALLIGVVTLYVLLPLSVLWLVVELVRHVRRR